MIRRGSIALCSKGIPGLVVSSDRSRITEADGSSRFEWTGLNLTTGGNWSAQDPHEIGYVHDVPMFLRAFLDNFKPAMQPISYDEY